jgi:hypothetical protein
VLSLDTSSQIHRTSCSRAVREISRTDMHDARASVQLAVTEARYIAQSAREPALP